MKRKSVRIMITMGLLLITAALSLTGYNIWNDMKSSIRANNVLQQLEFGFGSQEWKQNPDMEMPEIEIDGIWYVGALEIPALDLQLPVAGCWDEDASRTAPCRYTGSPYAGNMIIAGHNYRNHFGKLRNLKLGDKVYFTDLSGNSFCYYVQNIELVDGTDIERMKNGSGISYSSKSGSEYAQDEWNLTLFTCNFNGQARLTIRCL